MAFRKTLAGRVLSFCRRSSTEATAGRGGDGFLRRMLYQSRGIGESSSSSSSSSFQERVALSSGSKLFESLRSMNSDRLRLDTIRPPIPPDREEAKQIENQPSISVEDARKILRLSSVEVVKSKLRDTGKSYISFSDFVKICCEGCGQLEQGLSLAKALDESGAVLVLGNFVYLRPDEVAKAVERVIPRAVAVSEDDPRHCELRELERRKAEIDGQAEAGVRRELWGGLAYLLVQTAAFMRLTFWELSWDVMEPVCFYVTSVYFMAGYAFFLRTSRDPSFEGFFESRFAAKQRRLMRAANFDVDRFLELRRSLTFDLSPAGQHLRHSVKPAP
ncbi:calcium uniporter protein 3, mitochondrial-like [Wolffia australiana]